ncbi:hypothetical protein TNCV_1182421 [Trichonephila clavipes]|nr:hypothetical protein TNCV_1182421 [Trichonephila clavipes]
MRWCVVIQNIPVVTLPELRPFKTNGFPQTMSSRIKKKPFFFDRGTKLTSFVRLQLHVRFGHMTWEKPTRSAININSFAEFEKLIIDWSLLIPENTQHCIVAKSIQPCGRFGWLSGGQHMIDYAWDCQNKSIFHRQSQYDGDMTCVCSGQATFRTRFFGFPVDGPLAGVVFIY